MLFPDEAEGTQSISSLTTPRPSYSSPDTQPSRTSTDKPARRAFPSAYTTPHDAVVSELLGSSRSGHVDGQTRSTARPPSIRDESASPDIDIGSRSEAHLAPNPGLQPHRLGPNDILLDPFDGTVLGTLVPHSSEINPNELPSPNNAEGTGYLNSSDSEAVWSQLSSILDIQDQLTKMHLEMEGVGRVGNLKMKRNEKSSDDSPVPPHGPVNLGKNKSTSVKSNVSSSSETEGDEEVVNAEKTDQESKKNRLKEEEFAELATQFDKKKAIIDNIMVKLDDLSKAMFECHSLQAPNIEFPSTRQNSSAAPTSTSQKPGKEKRTSVPPFLDPSSIRPQTQHAVTAASPSITATEYPAPLSQGNDIKVPTLLVNSVDMDEGSL